MNLFFISRGFQNSNSDLPVHLSNAILAPKKVYFIFWHFTKMCYANFPPFTVKASPKIAYHKIQWLQFANKNIARLQSWHSSQHFQIPITHVIWLCNFDLALTATLAWQAQLYLNMDFPNKIGWRVIAKVNWYLKHWMHWCEGHYAVFRWKIWIGLEFLTLENRPKTIGLYLWSALCRESKSF